MNITLGLINNKANNILEEIKEGGLWPTDELFFVCMQNYNNAINAVREAYGAALVTQKRFEIVSAEEEAKTCGNKLKHVPAEFSILREKNRNFLYLCSIFKVVANRLI